MVQKECLLLLSTSSFALQAGGREVCVGAGLQNL